jgi:hypothetical protein
MRIRSRALSLLVLSGALLGTNAHPGRARERAGAVSSEKTAGSRVESALTPLAVATGGDTCATATLIPSLPFNDSGDSTGATDNIRLTGCAGISLEGPDLIYVFNVQSGNSLTFTLTPTDAEYDPAIYIRTACAQGTGSCVSRTDVGKGGQPETLTVSGLAPGTYYFYVDSVYPKGDPAGEGHYNLSVTGTLGTSSNSSLYTLTPCRVLDTREPASGPALVAGASRNFTITGPPCMVPTTAKSVSVNVTVTEPTSPGYLTLYPGGAARPLASTINFSALQTRANNAILPVGTNGTITVFDGQAAGTIHFILDVNGYFQ